MATTNGTYVDGLLKGDPGPPGDATNVAGQPIAPSSVTTPGDVTVGGQLIQGTKVEKAGSGATTGPGTVVVLTLPLGDNSVALLSFGLTGAATGAFASLETPPGLTAVVLAGTFVLLGPTTPAGINLFGLPVVPTVTWTAGVLSITITGPTATIVGLATADAGTSTIVETSTANGAALDPTLSGMDITISGVTGGGAGINGTHSGGSGGIVWIDAAHFKINGQVFGVWVSGGTVVLAAPPSITWNIDGALRVSTAP